MFLLSLRPHCSRKLQAFDHSVYGSLKKQIKAGNTSVCTNKKPMTIYDIKSIFIRDISMMLTPVSIMEGLLWERVIFWEIIQLNAEIFTDLCFMPSDWPASSIPNIESIKFFYTSVILHLRRICFFKFQSNFTYCL